MVLVGKGKAEAVNLRGKEKAGGGIGMVMENQAVGTEG